MFTRHAAPRTGQAGEAGGLARCSPLTGHGGGFSPCWTFCPHGLAFTRPRMLGHWPMACVEEWSRHLSEKDATPPTTSQLHAVDKTFETSKTITWGRIQAYQDCQVVEPQT